ncbi:MAG: hypothetical protein ACM3S2_19965 [Ignavibacteriales bacterium]
MKLLTLFLLTAVLMVSSINNVSVAQVNDSTEVKTNLPQNTFCFYFINGYALAYKFYNSGNSNLRLRIDLSSSYSDMKSDRNEKNSSSQDMRTVENNNSNSLNNITAEFAYSYNFYRSHLGQAYAGAGPFISYNRNKQVVSNKDSYTSNINQTNTNLTYGFSAGLSAFIGLEAFLNQSLRVFAETQLTGGKNWSKSEYVYEYVAQSDSSRGGSSTTVTSGNWFYNLTSVRIGLGISI